MSSLYHDRPLRLDGDYIRLLYVEIVDNAVQYDLISNICLTTTRPQYLALSYCWGDPDDIRKLKVGRHELTISSNLASALRKALAYHTSSSRSVSIWCDQICIDQSNVSERNHQVVYMSQIYTRAEEVLVWLPTAMPKHSMFPWESRSYQDGDGKWNNWKAWKEWHLKQLRPSSTGTDNQYTPSVGDKLRASVRLAEALGNLQAIVGSAWWQRAWIFQEFVLASRSTFLIQRMSVPWRELDEVLTAHYDCLSANKTRNDEALQRYTYKRATRERTVGNERFSSDLGALAASCWSLFRKRARALKLSFHLRTSTWTLWSKELRLDDTRVVQHVFAGVSKCYNRSSDQGKLVNFILETKRTRTGQNELTPLSRILQHARLTLCKDDRDKVFAFLGVIDNEKYNLRADYHLQNTSLHVLVQAASQVIIGESSLNSVIMQALADERPLDLNQRPPSWVPNLYERPGLNKAHRRHLKHIDLDTSTWRASKMLPPAVSFTTDIHGRPDFALVAKAVRVTKLLSVSHDPDREPWKTFDGSNDLKIQTRNTARVQDEVWVILGLNVPLTLSRIKRAQPVYTILDIAMLWDKDGVPSTVLHGSMIDLLHAGSVRARRITIV